MSHVLSMTDEPPGPSFIGYFMIGRPTQAPSDPLLDSHSGQVEPDRMFSIGKRGHGGLPSCNSVQQATSDQFRATRNERQGAIVNTSGQPQSRRSVWCFGSSATPWLRYVGDTFRTRLRRRFTVHAATHFEGDLAGRD